MLEKKRSHRLTRVCLLLALALRFEQVETEVGVCLGSQEDGRTKTNREGLVERAVHQIDDWIPDGALVYGAIRSVAFPEKYNFDQCRGDDVAAEDRVIVPLMDPAIKSLDGDIGDQILSSQSV